MPPSSEGPANHGWHRVYKAYLEWPEALLRGYRRGLEEWRPWAPGILVGCGMGGSAYSIRAASLALADEGVYVIVNTHYSPPRVPGSGVLSVSYSGETLETIECTRRALDSGLPAGGVAGVGSSLYRLLRSRGAPVVGLEGGGLPRASLAELAGAVLGLTAGERVEPLVREASRALSGRGELEGLASRVARALAGAPRGSGDPLVVVVSCEPWDLLGYRWRSELAENAGVPVLVERYPEAGHNSVAAWDYYRGAEPLFILVKHSVDDEVCASIEDHVEAEYAGLGRVVTVDLRRYEHIHPFAAALANAVVAGLASVLLARDRGKDPAATPGIERYKGALRRLARDKLTRDKLSW
ncbi:MAG: hypothetical protein GSR80_001136 [Desulfurococcales archaeon]|nr:hypothetical protein [Desulfurococcales archaeon]